MLLAAVCFIDELAAGVPSAGAAPIRDDFAVDYSSLALILLVAPQVLALVFEAPLLLLSDRVSRRKLSVAALLTMSLSLSLAGLFRDPWFFAAAIALFSPASGLACGIAQAQLVDSDPEHREERMADWTLGGALGDLMSPVLLASMAHLGWGWRGALFAVSGVIAIWALRMSRMTFGNGRLDQDEETPQGPPVDRIRLVSWIFGWTLCSFLDEAFTALAVLLVRDLMGGGVLMQTAMVMASTIGNLIGIAAMPRALKKLAPLPLLALTSGACAIAYTAWIFAPSIALMFITGIFTGPLYPLAKAQAYRAMPGRSGLVNALGVIFQPVDLAMPLALGFIADAYGLRAALLVLLAQPLGLSIIALFNLRAR